MKEAQFSELLWLSKQEWTRQTAKHTLHTGCLLFKIKFKKKDRMKSKLGYINPYAIEHCSVTCGCFQGLLAGP